jgi:arsenate reductase-like glutaredoxin family protein
MAELTQEHFEGYMESFAKMVKEGFDATATKAELRKVQATMVTKDYLDDKLADLRGDLTILMRKEDTKLKKLVEKLHAKHVLDDADVRDLAQMEPFPALAL